MNPAQADHRNTAGEAAAERGAATARAGPPGQAPARTGGRPPAGLRATAVRFAPVIAAVAAMSVAGVWGLARDSAMGNDEVATRWAALLSLRELAHLLRHVDAVHGLYYLLMHGWVVFGSSPAALRVPSVISMAIGAGLVAILGRRLTGSGWAGLFAGLVMAVTPSITYYAQTARSYALVFACVAGATLTLVYALRAEADGDTRRSTRRWVGYAALVALGAYLNEMSLLVLAAHGSTVLLARYGPKVIRRWLVAAACGGIVVLPLAALSLPQHAAIGWVKRPGLDALRTLFHDYFGATAGAGLLVLACVVIAVLPERGSTVWWRRGGVSLPAVALPLLVLPALLLLAESLVAQPLFVDRYVIYAEAGAALLAGGGAVRIGRWLGEVAGRPGRALIWVPGVALCACVLLLQLTPLHRVRTPQSRKYNFEGPSLYLAANAQQGDGVLYFGTLFRKAALGYPADYRKVTDFGVALTPLQAGTFRGRDKSFAQTAPLMLRYRRIWVIGYRPSVHLPDALLRQESTVLEQHFSLLASHRFRGIVVTLWQRQ